MVNFPTLNVHVNCSQSFESEENYCIQTVHLQALSCKQKARMIYVQDSVNLW